MKPTLCLLVVLLISSASASGESLWEPEFSGYISGKASLQAGDTVLISINTKTSLSFSASQLSTESLTLQLSGGEGGDLFSFLPTGAASGNQSLKGNQEVAIKSEIAVRITDIDENGVAGLTGGRSISIDGKQETVTFTGFVNRIDIGEDRRVDMSRVTDARIIYRTVLQSAGTILRDEDLVEITSAPAPVPAEAEVDENSTSSPVDPTVTESVAAETSATAAEVPVDQSVEPASLGISITEEKKRELLLLYLNRIIDLVFQED